MLCSCLKKYPQQKLERALRDLLDDASAPTKILELTATAITYCCNNFIVTDNVNSNSTTESLLLAEQYIQMLANICEGEIVVDAVFESGGLNSVLSFIRNSRGEQRQSHKDALIAATVIISKLCTHIKLHASNTIDDALIECLSKLLLDDDEEVATCALKCFVSLANHFDLKRLANDYCLFKNASSSNTVEYISRALSLLLTLCRGSTHITHVSVNILCNKFSVPS